MFDIHGLRQFVQSPTRRTNDVSDLLDLVVGRDASSCISDVVVHSSHHASDHDIVTWSMASRLKPVRQLVDNKFRSLQYVDWSSFQADVLSSELCITPTDNVDEFAVKLDTVITEILDRHCPLQKRRKHLLTRCDDR